MFIKKPQNSRYIQVPLPRLKQEIIIGEDLSKWTAEEIKQREYYNHLFIVDPSFASIHKDYLETLQKELNPVDIIYVDAVEDSKTLDYFKKILDRGINSRLNRNSCVVGIGGGIVGDIGGFFSSIYMRGVDFVFIPTTLMAQADTTLYKVAIGKEACKNIVGNFYSPVLSVCDIALLKTLPKKEIVMGFSEVIKHALIASKKFSLELDSILTEGLEEWQSFDWKKIIYKSLKLKAKLVLSDPFDKTGEHKGLSYGHTFANALEGLSSFKFRHGEAIAVGMYISGLVSVSLGYLSRQNLDFQQKLLMSVGLPNKLPKSINDSDIIALLKKDKISLNDGVSLVVLEDIGKFKVEDDVDQEVVGKAIRLAQAD